MGGTRIIMTRLIDDEDKKEIVTEFMTKFFAEIIEDWNYVIDTNGIDMTISLNGMTDWLARTLQMNERDLRDRIESQIKDDRYKEIVHAARGGSTDYS